MAVNSSPHQENASVRLSSAVSPYPTPLGKKNPGSERYAPSHMKENRKDNKREDSSWTGGQWMCGFVLSTVRQRNIKSDWVMDGAHDTITLA
ncbi:hypothetical protein RRG08_061733 [Elysia crispata]|uniref:Uncharacterized protein n=1 Tax=Elysia crispata TaxID=231223 RepID=A0AAE1DUY5_9GAST|nr:hypothetical protein RRG08_061733 [Elysia crispata]